MRVLSYDDQVRLCGILITARRAGLNPAAREQQPVTRREVTTADEPAITQAELSGRSSTRSRDELGQELLGVAATLGARGLETVLAYAQFVKARRGAS